MCSPLLADLATDLVSLYIQWHAADIYDWHLLTDNVEKLPASCVRLARAIDSSSPSASSSQMSPGSSDTGSGMLGGGGNEGVKKADTGSFYDVGVVDDPILKAISNNGN